MQRTLEKVSFRTLSVTLGSVIHSLQERQCECAKKKLRPISKTKQNKTVRDSNEQQNTREPDLGQPIQFRIVLECALTAPQCFYSPLVDPNESWPIF